MYGIFTYIYHENQPNVGKYTIHGSYGYMLHQYNTPIVRLLCPYVCIHYMHYIPWQGVGCSQGFETIRVIDGGKIFLLEYFIDNRHRAPNEGWYIP